MYILKIKPRNELILYMNNNNNNKKKFKDVTVNANKRCARFIYLASSLDSQSNPSYRPLPCVAQVD